MKNTSTYGCLYGTYAMVMMHRNDLLTIGHIVETGRITDNNHLLQLAKVVVWDGPSMLL